MAAAVTFPLVTRLMVRRALVDYGLQHKTNAEIDAAISQVNQKDVFDQERSKYSIEVWDKTSPINGVDAERVIREYRIPEDGTAYMILEGGRIVFFQTQSPITGDLVTPDNAEDLASDHLDHIAASNAIDPILEQIITHLDY